MLQELFICHFEPSLMRDVGVAVCWMDRIFSTDLASLTVLTALTLLTAFRPALTLSGPGERLFEWTPRSPSHRPMTISGPISTR
jgi:hypothetical protein